MLAQSKDQYASDVPYARAGCLDSIDEAISDIAEGRLVILAERDDQDDGGGYLVGAAELMTPALLVSAASRVRGLTFVSIAERERGLERPRSGEEPGRAAFAVALDPEQEATALMELIHGLARSPGWANQTVRMDHGMAIAAKDAVLPHRPVLLAAADLARLAGLRPAGVLVEVLNDGGMRARSSDLRGLAERLGLKVITTGDLAAYRLCREQLVARVVEVDMPTRYGGFRLIAFEDRLGQDCHLALVKGTWEAADVVLVRVHSECVTGEVFHSLRCDCGEQLSRAIDCVAKEGRGCILYMKQEGRGIGLINKLRSYELQQEGLDTVEANEALGFREDHRDYGIASQMLRDLGVRRLRLLTNNPAKQKGLETYGLEVVERVPLEISPTPQNERYLLTKRDRMGHEILCGE